MKKSIKRILSLLMSCAMAASMLGTVAFAEESDTYTEEQTYVLSYDNGSKPYLYGSRYSFDHSYNDPAAGPNSVWNYNNCPEIFNLVSSLDDDSIAAYCTDADTSTTSNTTYRRINLEDSTYHEAGAAPRLRSILLNSFPQKSVEEVSAAANVAGYSVTNLAQGELISATQQAIWEITHGAKYSVDSHYDGIRDMSSYRTSDFVYPESLDATETEYTASNMTNLYNYFLNMAGTDPLEATVSAASFENAQVTYATEDDDTLTATVKTTVNAVVKGDAALTLTAVCEGKSAAEVTVKNGTHNYTLTIEGLTDVSEISLAIDGTQTLADVFLFDAVGDRTTSQSMIGYDDSTLPVHAETKIVENERILNIRKIGKLETKDAEGNITYETINLANIVFDVYFVGTLEDYLDGKVEILDEPTAKDAVKQVASLKTDENGEASLNLTRKGLEDGVYLVIEKQSAATTTESLTKPFYVLLPYTNNSGDSWEYVVNAQPKNTLIGGPEIVKDVTSLGNDHDTFAVNEAHTWIISADIPADIADGIKYEISDTLDARLDYVGNVKVTAETEVPVAEKTVELVADTDYILTETKNEPDGTRVDKFTVALTAAGMDKVAEAVDANKVDTIRVYFDTKINDKAEMDAEIPNQAILQYTNSTNYTYEDESDIPEVHTGGFNLVKVDGASKSEADGTVTYANKLSGAEFKLYRDATEAEIAANEVEAITLENGEVKQVVCITTLKSDENGAASYDGLAYGTYYLVETKAPVTENGAYNLLLHPVVVTVEKGSYLKESALTVENFSGFELPETGGIGTTIYTAMGTLMICAAGAYIILSKKRAVC